MLGTSAIERTAASVLRCRSRSARTAMPPPTRIGLSFVCRTVRSSSEPRSNSLVAGSLLASLWCLKGAISNHALE